MLGDSTDLDESLSCLEVYLLWSFGERQDG